MTVSARASSSLFHNKMTRMVAFLRLVRTRLDKKNEMELFRLFAVVSLGIHFFFFLAQGINLLNQRRQIVEDWAIDADLLVDATSGAPKDSALPDAVKAEEAKVSERMLPQLPKQFAVDNQEAPKDKTFTEQDEKAEAEKKVEDARDLSRTKDEAEEKNRLKKDDALRRLALEKLRQENKLAKKNEAASTDSPRLQDDSKAVAATNTGAVQGTLSASEANRYRARLQSAIRRNYSIPETLKFRTVSPVTLAIEISESGHLVSSKVEESSGDTYFDELALQAAKASVPLPPPPAALVNQKILFKFNP
ncbi:MAG: TonB terminal [Pseudomonadota bacterium]|jgi:TolA protein